MTNDPKNRILLEGDIPSQPLQSVSNQTRRNVALLFLLGGCLLLPFVRAWDHTTEGQLVARRQESADWGLSGAVWTFARAPNGDFFVGGDGVLLSRTLRQLKMPVPTSYGFKALAADATGRVWVGAVGEIGFLEMDATGEYKYTSLLSQFHDQVGPTLGPLQTAHVLENVPIFVGEEAVYAWSGGRFSHWSLPSAVRLQPLRPNPSHLWIYQRGQGILALTPKGPLRKLGQSDLPGEPTWLLAPVAAANERSPENLGVDDGWLLGTSERVYARTDKSWREIPGFAAQIGAGNATHAIRLDSSTSAVATQNLGVLIFTDQGALIGRVDRDNALSDNQTHALWSDQPGELSVGTANGWTRITSPERISTFPTGTTRRNDPVRSVVALPDAVFAATALGVHKIVPGAEPGDASRLVALPPTPGPVWTLAETNGELFAGGLGGLWRWDGKSWLPLHSSTGDVLTTHASHRYPGRLYYTDGPNLHAIERRNGAWIDFPLGQSAGDTPSSLLEDAQGDVWVSTVLKGVKRFRLSETLDGAPVLTLVAQFRPGIEMPANRKRPKLFSSGPRVVLFDETEMFTFNEARQAFQSFTLFEGLKGVGISAPLDNGATYWLMERREPQNYQQILALAEVSVGPDGKWQATPLATDSLNVVGQAISVSMQPSSAGPVIWLAAARGLARLGRASMTVAPATPLVQLASVITGEQHRRVQSPQSNQSKPYRLPLRGEVDIPTQTQYLIFEFSSAPAGSATGDMAFQSQLAGLQQDWTPSQTLGLRDFTGLAPGEYEFRARAVDRFGRPGPAVSYRFRRLAPWYARWPMWFAYGVLLVGSVALGVRLRLRQLNRQNERLNRMVDERTRELAMANSAKMDFLTSISHEIRNPLNGVVGLVNLLKESALGPRERELTGSLSACARSLRRVFDEVLSFARLEEGRVPLRESAFRLQTLLEDTVKVFSAEAAQRGCELRLTTDHALPPLRGDHEKIRTIVSNFVANALKYAPGAPVEIETQTEVDADGRIELTLQVRDQGRGIPAEEQELIFRKFVRGTGAAEQRESGAGLGLATCQALAHLLGGSVGVESPSTPPRAASAESSSPASPSPDATSPSTPPQTSQPAGGSTFFLRLTLTRASEPLVETEPEIQPSAALAAEDDLSHPGARIPQRALVVEDQVYNQQVARSILHRLDYIADVAPDAESCRRLADAHEHTLILLDWDVPGAKGNELARWLRARPNGQGPVILAVTAHDSEDIRQLCLDSGMDEFLVKPLDELTLANAVAAARARRAAAGGSALDRDFRIFDYLGQNDPERTRSATSEYIEQLETERTELRRAVESNDSAAVARLSHRLRAHAAIVRCAPLIEAARQLQQAAASGEIPRELFDHLEEKASALQADLAAFSPKLTATI